MKIDNTISESAFLVNESRARRVDISHDIYANLWTNKSTNSLWDDFSKNVYKFDDIELSLRNRFFLEQLNSFIQSTKNPIFINIGAGFTSYPFLIKKPCTCIELDLKHVIDYKSKRIQSLIKEKKLPNRKIDFFAVDICNKSEIDLLKDKLLERINNNPSFILLEGITYFLDKNIFKYILDMSCSIQKSNSHLLFDFWDLQILTNPIFKKLVQYFHDKFGFKETNYNLFNIDFLLSIKDYDLIEFISNQGLEKRYLKTNILNDYNKILPENYVVLKRN